MGDFSTVGGVQRTAGGALDAANSRGVALLAHQVTQFLKGDWVTVIDPIPFQASGLYSCLRQRNTSGQFVVDYGVGPPGGGSEVVVVHDIPVAHAISEVAYGVQIPVQLPRGQRLAARCAHSGTVGASRLVDVQTTLFAPTLRGARGLSRARMYGLVSDTWRGATVDPGGTINTKGAYTQIVAATSHHIRALNIFIGRASLTAAMNTWLVDVAIGAGGSEKIVLPDLMLVEGPSDLIYPLVIGPVPLEVPAGTRLAARAQCNRSSGSEHLFDIFIQGIS